MDYEIQTACVDSEEAICISVHMEDRTIFTSTMFLFKLFQSGLIFTALVSGLICLTHLIYCRTTNCRNSATISAMLLVGFCHMIACVYLLEMSEESADYGAGYAENQGCVDYFIPATFSNTAVLVIIIHNIIRYNWTSKLGAVLTWTIALGSVLVGLSFILCNQNDSLVGVGQESIMTLGSKNQTHLDVFWSVCRKDLYNEKYRLVYEYGLIYFPVVIVILSGWYQSHRETKGSLFNLKIISNESCDCKWETCDCSNLNPALIAILIYSAVVLLLARPLEILYARSTDGYFRDVLPGLLHTVMYCFLCSEYISKIVFKKYNTKMRIYPGNNKSILYV